MLDTEKSTAEQRRAIAIFVVSVISSLCGWFAAAFACYFRNETLFLVASVCTVPFLGFTVYQSLSVYAFPFPYSYFGSRKRTPFPDHCPRQPTFWTSIFIGRHFRASGCGAVWCSKDGVGLLPLPFDRVFIPIGDIRGMTLKGTHLTIDHVCPEVRNPVRVILKNAFFQNSAWTAAEREAAVAALFRAWRERTAPD